MYNKFGMSDNFKRHLERPIALSERKDIIIGYHKGEPVYSDEPRTLRFRMLCAERLPIRTVKPRDPGLNVPEVVYPINNDQLFCLNNVPPKPSGYYWRNEDSNISLTPIEDKCLQEVLDVLFPSDFFERNTHYSYVKRTSSTGAPFHSNQLPYKLASLSYAMEILSSIFKNKDNITDGRQFAKLLVDKYGVVPIYFINNRIQVDSRSKKRQVSDARGNRVDVDRSISKQGTEWRIILDRAKQEQFDVSLLKDFEPYAGRYRNIASGFFMNGFLSLPQRALIARRKEYLPFLKDEGPIKNAARLLSEGMQYNGPVHLSEREKDKVFVLAYDMKNFDGSWAAKYHHRITAAYDNILPSPWAIMHPMMKAAFGFSKAHQKTDIVPGGWITHDPYLENVNEHLYCSNLSGNPGTKLFNDTASVGIWHTVFTLLKIPSFIHHPNELMTRSLPYSLLINGDDWIFVTKNADWANLLFKAGEIVKKVAMWYFDNEIPAIFNNMALVWDPKDQRIKFIRVLISYFLKTFLRETSVDRESTGAIKTNWQLGLYLRKLSYDHPIFHSYDKIINDTWKEVFGYPVEEDHPLSPAQKDIMHGITNMSNIQMLNAATLMTDPEKLHYLESLQDVPEEIKLLFYFSFSPDDLRKIHELSLTTGKFPFDISKFKLKKSIYSFLSEDVDDDE